MLLCSLFKALDKQYNTVAKEIGSVKRRCTDVQASVAEGLLLLQPQVSVHVTGTQEQRRRIRRNAMLCITNVDSPLKSLEEDHINFSQEPNGCGFEHHPSVVEAKPSP